MLVHRPRPAALVAVPALLLGSLLAGPLTPAATAAPAPYDAGLSTPQEDSYYPAQGDPGIDALHYGLDLTWDRSRRRLSGVADIAVRATKDARSFQLDLGHTLRPRKVTVDGRRAPWTHPHRVLRVKAPVVAGRRYDVRVVYVGTPRPVEAPTTRSDFDTVGMSVTSDGQLRTQQEPFGALTWYPVNDQPSDKALYDVRVTAPRDWVGVSNGRLVKRTTTQRHTITRFHLAHPAASYLTTLAVGPYVHRRATGPHGLPLNFWLPRGEVDRYLKGLRHVGADLRWLEARLGPYPFESAGVVVVPGASAMETQTLVTMGAQSWRGPAAGRETMVHELVHQWYGDTVTPSDWRDLWLNEGMAMYVQARWSADHHVRSWKSWQDFFRYANSAERAQEGGPGDYDPSMFATGCVYYCTARMYEVLRTDKIGDRAFWRIVREWPQRHRDENADRDDFETFVESRTHTELTDFFDRWLNSPVWPPA